MNIVNKVVKHLLFNINEEMFALVLKKLKTSMTREEYIRTVVINKLIDDLNVSGETVTIPLSDCKTLKENSRHTAAVIEIPKELLNGREVISGLVISPLSYGQFENVGQSLVSNQGTAGDKMFQNLKKIHRQDTTIYPNTSCKISVVGSNILKISRYNFISATDHIIQCLITHDSDLSDITYGLANEISDYALLLCKHKLKIDLEIWISTGVTQNSLEIPMITDVLSRFDIESELIESRNLLLNAISINDEEYQKDNITAIFGGLG